MSLSIILDKSTFQMLNFDEVVMLHNYYNPNITPILVMEVLGDLKKNVDSGEISPNRVIDFSKKLLPYNSVVNIFYKRLIVLDLQGKMDTADFRPIVGSVIPTKSATGLEGFRIEDSDEEKLLSRWRAGEFDKLDELIAQLWRDTTTKKDLLENLKATLQLGDKENWKLKTVEELNHFVNTLLDANENQSNIIKFIVEEFAVDAQLASEVFLRWEQFEAKKIEAFAPYAFYCCKVKLLFYFILKNDLFGGVKPTNLLDLEYLFYLPFCTVFSSNDKFHKNFVPLVIDSHQTFVVGEELKSDLKFLVDYRSTLHEKRDLERTRREPPHITTSLTYKLWSKYFDWPPKYKRVLSEEEIAGTKAKIDEFIAANPVAGVDKIDNSDFFVKHYKLKVTDLCPCGSGKMLKDCHMKP